MPGIKLVLLESPYAPRNGVSVETHIQYARRAIRDSLERGEAPIAGHLLYTQPGVLDDNVPEEREKGLSAHLAWMSRASLVVFYDDYGMSSGMKAALYAALTNRIPVEFRSIGLSPTEHA